MEFFPFIYSVHILHSLHKLKPTFYLFNCVSFKIILYTVLFICCHLCAHRGVYSICFRLNKPSSSSNESIFIYITYTIN